MIIHFSENIVEFDPMSRSPGGGVAMQVEDHRTMIRERLYIPILIVSGSLLRW